MSRRRLRNAARRLLDWIQGSRAQRVDPAVRQALIRNYRSHSALAEWSGGDDPGWPRYLERVARG